MDNATRRRIAILQGHPDPAGHHFCHALADAYVRGAIEAHHGLHRIEMAALGIPLLRTQQDFQSGALPASLAEAPQAIARADHIVLIFPLWLGTMPALVKAFLEQILRPGFGFAYSPRGFPKKLLAGKSARLVVTIGIPSWLYRWYFFAHGLRGLERNILSFVGIRPIRASLFGMVDAVSPARRKRWLDHIAKLGRRGD